MLSYQHIFHAGSLADVHKHALLAVMLGYMTQKDKPLTYLETHSGRGLYDLDAQEAVKTGEAAAGIDLVEAQGWFGKDHPYQAVLDKVRARHGARCYPGSPLVASHSLRQQDRMHLAELHPQEFPALEQAMQGKRTHCVQEDGYKMLRSLCPPEPRRGMVLIDPAYEVKSEYDQIAGVIERTHRTWNVGVIALWYPILTTKAHVQMLKRLEALGLPRVLRHEVKFGPAREGHRMIGSGMFIVNAPFGTEEEAARLSRLYQSL